jgi:hypothetical protein
VGTCCGYAAVAAGCHCERLLASGREVKIVTGIDDHSRYCVIAKAVMRATARPVCQAFVDAMAVYGVPEEVLSDIHPEWC